MSFSQMRRYSKIYNAYFNEDGVELTPEEK